MRYIWQHIQAIIKEYDGSLPLAHFLKNYFRQQPKLGSRDRRILSAMAYSWYRCSAGIRSAELSFEDKVKQCLLICHNDIQQLISEADKAAAAEIEFDSTALFPYDNDLSTGISKEAWLRSMLQQPDLFIRIRKNKQKIMAILHDNQITHREVTGTCLALPNGAKIDTLLPPDCYVVQDASSQQTGHHFNPHKGEQWYDCCSGAGGKSLLLKDNEPNVKLTVSDRRESILHNLKQRFKLYDHTLPESIVTDASNAEQLKKVLGQRQFDNIICDAPCSGSGTWARTPEQLFFFNPESIEKYSSLQKAIAVNVSDYLKKGGRLIYITCSIFAAENEQVVEHIVSHAPLHVAEQHLINGIANHADSMYIAVLEKK